MSYYCGCCGLGKVVNRILEVWIHAIISLRRYVQHSGQYSWLANFSEESSLMVRWKETIVDFGSTFRVY